MPRVPEIEDMAMRALLRAGVPEAHARIQFDLLLEAELRGHASHGLLRLPRIIDRIRNKVADPHTVGSVRWRGEALLDVDGQDGLGPVVALSALERVSARARTTGVAMAAIRRCNHLGMLAWYAEKIARQGQVVLALTTSEALVHPWGGRQAMLGTNPIAIGVPAEPVPFVLDMATSRVSMGKIHDYANRGQSLEEGWAVDIHGDPTTDAVAASQGSIAPFGGAKGFALGLAFEVMVASLTASALGREVRGTIDDDAVCNKGDVFIVMEPAAGMIPTLSDFLNMVRACPPVDPERPVLVPGDRAFGVRAQRLAGDVPIAAEIWSRIVDLAGSPSTASQI